MIIKTRWLILPFLITFVLLPRLSVDLYLPSLPHIGQALNSSDADLQMTMTIFMFGYALSMLIAGPLSDTIGKKKVMLMGLILFFAASMACALATSIDLLIIGRFFQALGGCCGTVVARVMVKENYRKEEQISMLAHLSTAMAISPIIAPILGGFFQEVLGWRVNFYLLSLIALIVFILGYRQLSTDIPKQKTLDLKTLLSHYKYLLSHRLFIGYSLAIGLAWSDYFAFTVESPFIFQNSLGLNAITFGMIFSLSIIGYILGTQLTKHIANNLGWDKLILIATIICLAFSILMLSMVVLRPLSWEIITFPMIGVMLGVGIIIPCTQAAVMQPFAEMPGTASGLFFFVQMLFGTVTGLLLAIFKKTSSLPMSIFIVTTSILLFLSFYFFIYKNRSRKGLIL